MRGMANVRVGAAAFWLPGHSPRPEHPELVISRCAACSVVKLLRSNQRASEQAWSRLARGGRGVDLGALWFVNDTSVGTCIGRNTAE